MSKPWRELGRYGGVGIELVLTILVLGALGHWLDDRYWGSHGWGTAAGFLLGVAVDVRSLVRIAARMQSNIERAEANDPQAGRWTVDEDWLHKPESADRAGDSESKSDPRERPGSREN